jgi:putative Holliday junction resolvase
MGRIVSIDFGLKRIGIAISDAGKKIAFPLTIVEGGKKGVENTVAVLKPKAKEIEKILVGYPLLMSGEVGEMAKLAALFGEKLQNELHIEVELCDERLSSKHADRSLKELSLSRKDRAKTVDMVAATLLLQSYLDKNF